MAGLFNTRALTRYLGKASKSIVKEIDDFASKPESYTAKSISREAQKKSGATRKDMNKVYKEYAKLYESMNPGAKPKEIKSAAMSAVLKQAEEGNLTPSKVGSLAEEESFTYRVPQTQELLTTKENIVSKPTEIARIGDNQGPVLFGGSIGPGTVESVFRPGVAQLKDPSSAMSPFSKVSGADDISTRVRLSDELGNLQEDLGAIGGTTYVPAEQLPGAPLGTGGPFVKRKDMIQESSLYDTPNKEGIFESIGSTPRTVKGEQRSIGGPEFNQKEFKEFIFNKQTGLLKKIRDINKVADGKEFKQERKANLEIGNILADLANRKQGEVKKVAKKGKDGKVLRGKDGKIKYEKKYVAFSQDNPKNWNQVVGGVALKDELANFLESADFKTLVAGKKPGDNTITAFDKLMKKVGSIEDAEKFAKRPRIQTDKSTVIAPLYKTLNDLLNKPQYQVSEKVAKGIGISRYKGKDATSNLIPYSKDNYIDLVLNAIAKSEGKKRTPSQTTELIKLLSQTTDGDNVGQTFKSPMEIVYNPKQKQIQRVRKDLDKETDRTTELTGTDKDILEDLDTPKDAYDADVFNPAVPEAGMVGSFSETGAGITSLTPTKGGPDIKQLLGKYIKADDKKAYSKLSTEDKAIVQSATRTYRDTKKRLRQENKEFKKTAEPLRKTDGTILKDNKGNVQYPERYSNFQIEDIAEQTALATVMQNINQAERSIFFSPEKMLKASDAELAAFLQPTEKDIGRGVTGPDFTQLDLQKPNVKIGTEELEAPFTTFKPLNVKEYTELLTGPPEVKAPVFNALNEFLKNPELYKDTIKQKEYLDILKDLMSTKLGLKKTKPTKKEQAALKKSTAKLNKVLKEINAKRIQRETIDTEELVEAPPAHFNIKKSPANLVTIVKKLERNKKLIREGFDDEVEGLSPQERELYNRAIQEGVIKKSNTGGLVSLKHRKKKSFIPKIIQNKKLKKRQQTKPKGVGAALRGWGAVNA